MTESLIGGNITDITQFDGVKLITHYWSTIKPSSDLLESFNIKIVDDSLVFVGDVHGDLNQFLAPLVLTNAISITDDVDELKVSSTIIYTPHYTINEKFAKTKTKIVYLGDLVDEWIFSRPVVHIMKDILTKLPNNVFYIYGNHDLAIIGRYHLFKQNKVNFPFDLPALWQTLKKELNHVRNLKIYKTIAELDGEPLKGYNYVYNYIEPIFDDLFHIFEQNLGKVSLAISIKSKPYIISHTTWTSQALLQLIANNDEIKPKSDRPSDQIQTQMQPILQLKPNIDDIQYIKQIASESVAHEKIDYDKLSKAVNNVFRTKSKLYVGKNLLSYTRILKNVICNHIIGHSSGAEFRDQNVNNTLSTYYHERESKLKPTFFNGRTIYYFDFGCSSGYDHDEIGRPDFVYSNSSGMFVSNLPAFSFILSNDKDSLLVMKDKTPRSANKIIFN